MKFDGAASFTAFAESVVALLAEQTPLPDWAVSRVADGEQILIHVRHHELAIVGERVTWNESLCSRMSSGGAHVVPDTRRDASYADLEMAEHVGAYAGYIFKDSNGEQFGVLCGGRRAPLVEGEHVDALFIQRLSELLSQHLALSLAVDAERRQTQLANILAETDPLTGLLNRRGWEHAVADAQERVDAFGDAVAIGIVDLNGLKATNDQLGHAAGDDLIARAGRVLRMSARSSGRIARLGGDEFGILAEGIGSVNTPKYFARIESALAESGLSAAVGYSVANPGNRDLMRSMLKADQNMYAHKSRQRSGRSE